MWQAPRGLIEVCFNPTARAWWCGLGSIAAALMVALCPNALHAQGTIRVSVIGESAGSWPLRLAEDKGFFKDAGLDVQFAATVDSGKQIEGLASGAFDVTHQASDHFVRGVREGKDIFVFMTISRPIFDFVVRPEIKSIGDLKGKTIALDNPTTGYWLLFKRVFAANGVKPEDYTLLPNVGGAESRYKAVQDNRAQGTFLNPPLSLRAIDGGLPRLTGLADHFKDLPGTSAGARREWARQNEATIVAYIRAYVRAVDYMLDPKNKAEALALISKRAKGTPKALEQTYDSFVRDGIVPGAAPSMAGLKLMLDVLVESGQLTADQARPETYADARYHQKAIGR